MRCDLRDITCSWVGKLNIVKMAVILNVIYQITAIPIKRAESYFVDINKLVLKVIREAKHLEQSTPY